MKLEHIIAFKNKIKAGSIVELRVDCNGKKTIQPEYYLLFEPEKAGYYYLVNIETGTALEVKFYKAKTKEEIQYLIKEYNGQVYDEEDAKLVLEETK